MKEYQIRSISIPLLLFIITVGYASAQVRNGAARLEGTWDAQVNITNCLTGEVLNTFPSIASFMKGGTSIGSTGGLPQSVRTPEHGIWRHDNGNNYHFIFKTFSFNQNVPSGWSIVEHQLLLNSTADAYTSSGTAKFYAPNGVQVGSGCSEAVGIRFGF